MEYVKAIVVVEHRDDTAPPEHALLHDAVFHSIDVIDVGPSPALMAGVAVVPRGSWHDTPSWAGVFVDDQAKRSALEHWRSGCQNLADAISEAARVLERLRSGDVATAVTEAYRMRSSARASGPAQSYLAGAIAEISAFSALVPVLTRKPEAEAG